MSDRNITPTIHTWRSVECYFKNPTTGETGWSIQMLDLVGTTRAEAAEWAKAHPHFDCFIDMEFDRYNSES